ncbi:DUF4235 domain-containing protein [Kitasatospora sp. NPDC088346]|uniref:DUF4235 domain-containing protein n=1 Tax=Kitasatospora sp. NPDC088346 TaxID=3364073 RepID=UPI00380AB6B8
MLLDALQDFRVEFGAELTRERVIEGGLLKPDAIGRVPFGQAPVSRSAGAVTRTREFAMGKILYKPLGLLFGSFGGVVAGAVLKRLWRLVGHKNDAPQAGDRDRTWREVLTAAALRGAVFALFRAAIDRRSAAGARRLTGA